MEVNPFNLQPIRVLLISQTKQKCEEAQKLFFIFDKPIQPEISITMTSPGV